MNSETSTLKADDVLAGILRRVARDTADQEYGSVQDATNAALILWLSRIDESDDTSDAEALDYAVGRAGFDSFEDFRDEFLQDSGNGFADDLLDRGDLE